MELQEEIDRLGTEIEEKRKMHQNLSNELEEIELRMTLLDAELVGLEQRRKALAEAAKRVGSSGLQPEASATALRRSEGSSSIDPTQLTMVDAVVRVVNESAGPMQIEDVRRRLKELGRDDDPGSVSVTLSYVATNGLIRHVARGLYGRL